MGPWAQAPPDPAGPGPGPRANPKNQAPAPRTHPAEETEKIIILSSFLAGGIGARGTPSIFVNEIFTPGYISKQQIINMLK